MTSPPPDSKKGMTAKDDIDVTRRRFLLSATATVGELGLAAAAIPFIAYWAPSVDTEAAVEPIQVG